MEHPSEQNFGERNIQPITDENVIRAELEASSVVKSNLVAQPTLDILPSQPPELSVVPLLLNNGLEANVNVGQTTNQNSTPLEPKHPLNWWLTGIIGSLIAIGSLLILVVTNYVLSNILGHLVGPNSNISIGIDPSIVINLFALAVSIFIAKKVLKNTTTISHRMTFIVGTILLSYSLSILTISLLSIFTNDSLHISDTVLQYFFAFIYGFLVALVYSLVLNNLTKNIPTTVSFITIIVMSLIPLYFNNSLTSAVYNAGINYMNANQAKLDAKNPQWPALPSGIVDGLSAPANACSDAFVWTGGSQNNTIYNRNATCKVDCIYNLKYGNSEYKNFSQCVGLTFTSGQIYEKLLPYLYHKGSCNLSTLSLFMNNSGSDKSNWTPSINQCDVIKTPAGRTLYHEEILTNSLEFYYFTLGDSLTLFTVSYPMIFATDSYSAEHKTQQSAWITKFTQFVDTFQIMSNKRPPTADLIHNN
jgi:hypothetical protein